ncbi:hypothetical protein K438DRAFT_1779704 [Mycena galopus ATCC 62051]|nr:hypothetical protein K438DRAFT_1779704 [Mycena galopus ATCC 62051]
MSVSTHTGSSPPSYRSEVPSSIRSGSLADSVSTRTVFSPPSYRSAPLPLLPAPPPPLPPPSLVTAPDYAAVDAVHYRIYTPSGAVPVKAAASSPDPFVGRILARSVPPPHLASMLKRRILAAEGLPDRTISVEESPKALLVSPSSPSSPSAPSSVSSRTSPSGTRRLSRLLGSLPSPLRTPYDSYPSSPSPPSPYQSITSTISLPSSTPDSASITSTNGTQIYASMYESEPMRDDAAVVLTGDGRHGASSDNPLAVVFLEELSVEERKARPEVEDFASREIPLDRYGVISISTRTHDLTSYGQFTTVSTTVTATPAHELSAAFDSVHTAF